MMKIAHIPMKAGIIITNYTFTKTKPIPGKMTTKKTLILMRARTAESTPHHIGITLNSDHARHDAIYYLNGLDPTKTVEKTKDGKTYTAYENLAYFDACAGGVLDDTDKLEAAYQDTSKRVSKSAILPPVPRVLQTQG